MRVFRAVALLALGLAVPNSVPAQGLMPAIPTALLGAPIGWAQEVRTVVTFMIAEDVAQQLLPAGWTLAPITRGPGQGANLVLVFTERLLTADAENKPVGGEAASITISIPGRKNDETAFAMFDGYTDASTAPGFYNVYKPARVSLARTTRTANLSSVVEEVCSVDADGGEKIAFRISYERGAIIHSRFITKTMSATDDKVRRTYRIDQGNDVVLSVPGNINRVRDISFAASGGKLAAIFDGRQKIVSVFSVPWYSRELYIPNSE